MDKSILNILLLSAIFSATSASTRPVFVYNNETKQLYTSSVLTWESYTKETRLANAVSGGQYVQSEDNTKAYICRATINSVPVSGYTLKHGERLVCIISQHQQMRTKQEFELLINRGNGAKVEWLKWEKLSPYYKINGLVSTGLGTSNTKDEVYYVARHPKNHSAELEHHEIDHAIGFLDSDGLGKIYVSASSKELSYESGELLRVIEPARYELSEIKLLSLTARVSSERIALGSTILKNEGSEEADVSATIGFDYKVVRNFGHQDGVARSVNTTAFITKNEKFEFFWGIEKEQKVVESKSVSTRLLPGTAINVTIWGNYSTSEGPYKAYIVTYFTDGSKTKKRQEQFTALLEKNLGSKLDIEYSDSYWLHNNTVIPTTTQRTVSTSTQSVHKTIMSTSLKSVEIEKITPGKPAQVITDEDAELDDEAEPSTASFLSEISFVSLVVLSSLKVIL